MASDLDELLRQLADPSRLAWNDETYNLARARTLSAGDRTKYLAKLTSNARQGDARAILTLGHLQATEVVPQLLADSESGQPWGLAARRALTLLGHGADVVAQIAEDATHSEYKLARLAAVMDLATIGGPVAIAALDRAIADVDYVVRVRAWDGLVAQLDLERFLVGPDGKRQKTTLLELLRDLLLSELAAFVTMGVDETRAITRAVAAGTSPDTLDLAWIPDPDPDLSNRILAAIVDPEAAFPIDDIAKLSGVPKRWAEAAIALRLEQTPLDVRLPDALARLFATWTVPALEEVAAKPETSPEQRARIESALSSLRAS
jgi:hypothetical protein